MENPSVIAITGAGSGIGAALASHYAAEGILLFLAGRHEGRLLATAEHCRAKGAKVFTRLLDVRDAPAMQSWLRECDASAPVDLVIANAGISGGTGGGSLHGETPEQTRAIFATNVDGVLNTVFPLIPAMVARGRGQIAIMGSLASFRGLPSAPAYSASKGAVRMYGEALRGYLAKQGVEVSVLCPGYIRTPMTQANPFPMPFIMNADKAARIMARGLARNRGRIAFPFALYFPLWLLGALPPWMTDPLFSRLPAKPANLGQ